MYCARRVLAISAVVAIGFAPGARAADPPQDVVLFFADLARALVDAHSDNPRFPSSAGTFLGYFDSKMPDYEELRHNVEDLVSRGDVESAIEFVTDEGDEHKRTLDLDWLLEIKDQPDRRKILKCTLEKRGKKWKITSLSPVDFFKF
jgi:hypothetical protein